MASGSLVRTNCQPLGLTADGQLAFNTRLPNNLWDVRVGDANAAPFAPYDGHRGGSDMSADGRWLLLTTAYGSMRANGIAEPGKGVGNDIELYDFGTHTLKRLTTGRSGIIWARLKPDMTKIVWAELLLGGGWLPWSDDYLGSWALHVADLDAAAGTLTNEKVWTPPTKAFVETYGWMPGTNRLIFATDSGVGQQEGGGWTGHWFASQLHTMPEDLSSAPLRFSPPMRAVTWDWTTWSNKLTLKNVYHEFAHFNGDGKVYTSVAYDAPGGAMDLWSYETSNGFTGSSPKRVSFLAGDSSGKQVPGFPPPRYVVVGGLVWDGSAFLAGVAGDSNAKTIDCYRLTL